MDIHPTGGVASIGADLLKLSACFAICPDGKVRVDVNLVFKIPEVFFFTVPAAVDYGITEHRQVRRRPDGFTHRQEQRVYGVLFIILTSLADVDDACGGIPGRPPAF